MNANDTTINEAIARTGRGSEWFNIELATQALENIPGISADTAVNMADYSQLTCELGDCGELIYECWREWDGKTWRVQLLPELEDGILIIEAEAPGDPSETTEETLNAPGKPTLTQLGL